MESYLGRDWSCPPTRRKHRQDDHHLLRHRDKGRSYTSFTACIIGKRLETTCPYGQECQSMANRPSNSPHSPCNHYYIYQITILLSVSQKPILNKISIIKKARGLFLIFIFKSSLNIKQFVFLKHFYSSQFLHTNVKEWCPQRRYISRHLQIKVNERKPAQWAMIFSR